MADEKAVPSTERMLQLVLRTRAKLYAREARDMASALKEKGGEAFTMLGEKFDEHAAVIRQLLAELERVDPE